MLRVLLLLLILANLLFFVWAQGLLGGRDEGHEPQRLAKQIDPDKLRVKVMDPVLAAAAAESCRLVKGLLPSEVQRVVALAEAKAPGLHFTVKTRETPSNLYWISIPPQPDRPAAEKKQLELKNRGVVNFSLILEEGANKFAISLGVFDSEQPAKDYMQELQRRGVRSARLQIRENLLDKTQMEVRGPGDMLAKQLPELLGEQGAASALNIGDCDAGR